VKLEARVDGRSSAAGSGSDPGDGLVDLRFRHALERRRAAEARASVRGAGRQDSARGRRQRDGREAPHAGETGGLPDCRSSRPRLHFSAMQIVLNGESREVREGLTLEGLLGELGLAEPMVATEVNLQIVTRAERARRALAPGDRVEIVSFVGGG
jgi:thiamine biosynthesis protein ThiS